MHLGYKFIINTYVVANNMSNALYLSHCSKYESAHALYLSHCRIYASAHALYLSACGIRAEFKGYFQEFHGRY